MSKVLIVHAHPEPKSLTSALKDHATTTLRAHKHEVQVSDLYASAWNAVASRADFLQPVQPDRLLYATESGFAFAGRSQSADIEGEQEKLLWADAVILSFPMWWFSMPAILKGWIDRVFALGFAYGVGEHEGERWGDRYGEGTLTGRRAMLTVTMGGHESHYGPRGVNGAIDDILWPIQHGVLFYPGMEVLPPFLIYQSHGLTEADWPEVASRYERRLEGLFTDRPIPFRTQNSGHYDAQQALKPRLGGGGGSRGPAALCGRRREFPVRTGKYREVSRLSGRRGGRRDRNPTASPGFRREFPGAPNREHFRGIRERNDIAAVEQGITEGLHQVCRPSVVAVRRQ